MPVDTTPTIFAKCTPLIRNDFDNCEGLTLCDVSPTTADELASIYIDGNGKFRKMGALLETLIEGKMCGIREHSLADFLIANAVTYDEAFKMRAANSSVEEQEPFLRIRRKGVINANYWKYTNASSTPGTAPNSESYTHYVDAVSISSIPANIEWFPEGIEIFILGMSSSGTAVRSAYVVVDAETLNDTTTRVYLNSRNAATALPGSKVQFTDIGLVLRGLNNVNDYESYCRQIPALNPNQQYLAWTQDTRWSTCEDDFTMEYKKRIVENNPLYREFIHVESVEYNKQQVKDFKARLANAFFFSKKISANQTETAWKNLDTIESLTLSTFSGLSARCVGRRANMVGVYEQLYECGRVFDLQGQILNVPELQQFLYDIQRVRRDNGDDANVIEIAVDSAYRVQFVQGLWRYLTGRYEGAIRAVMNIPTEKTTDLGFTFTEFVLDYPAGLKLRIVSHTALDDLLTAHRQVSPAIENAGRWALILDWNSIHLGVISSESVTRRSASAEEWGKFNETALCTIKVPQKTMKLYSSKLAVVVDCPTSSLWLENFSFGVPEHEQPVGEINGGGDWTPNNGT